MTSSKFDSLVKKAELFEKLAVYGGRKAFLESLAQDVMPEMQVPGKAPGEETDYSGYGKTYKTAPMAHGEYIDPKVQSVLIKMYPDTMSGTKADSTFGPRTQGAMNRWMAEHHVNMSLRDPKLWQKIIDSGLSAKMQEQFMNDPYKDIGVTPVKPLHQASDNSKKKVY